MASWKRPEQPIMMPVATWLAVAMLSALIVLGAVLLRDGAVVLGWIPGNAWMVNTLWGSHRFSPDTTTLTICAGVGLAGMALIIASLVASRKTALLADRTGRVWLDRGGAAQIAQSVSADVDGVIHASARVGAHKVQVMVQATDQVQLGETKTEVETRVRQAFEGLPKPPHVVVHVRQ